MNINIFRLVSLILTVLNLWISVLQIYIYIYILSWNLKDESVASAQSWRKCSWQASVWGEVKARAMRREGILKSKWQKGDLCVCHCVSYLLLPNKLPQSWQLKAHLGSCRGPEAQGLTGSSAQGCSQGIGWMAFSSEGSTGEGPVHTSFRLLAESISRWMHAWGPWYFAGCWLEAALRS